MELTNLTAAKEFNLILNEAPPEIRYQLIDWWHNWVSQGFHESMMSEQAYHSLQEDSFDMARKMMASKIGELVASKTEVKAELINSNHPFWVENVHVTPFYLFRTKFLVIGRKKNEHGAK